MISKDFIMGQMTEVMKVKLQRKVSTSMTYAQYSTCEVGGCGFVM